MTKKMVLIDRFIGLDLKNEKVHHVKVTSFYLDGATYRLGVKFLPEATGDPEIKKKLHAIWCGIDPDVMTWVPSKRRKKQQLLSRTGKHT